MSFARRKPAAPQRPDAPANSSIELQRFANAGRLAEAVAGDLLSALGIAQNELTFVCELLDDTQRRGELRSAAEDARAAISRAVSRAASVLSLARARPGRAERVDVREVVTAALFDLEPRLAGYTLVREVNAVPPVRADRGAILQTLVSLLLDAADASPPRGRIRIAARREEKIVEIAIEDEGPAPIAPEALLQQRDGTLWLCRNAVQSFAGELAVRQGPLGGRLVILQLLIDGAQ